MTHMDDILTLVGMAEVRRRAECYDELVAALEFTLTLLANLTTEEFQCGGDKPAREAIEAALAKARMTP